VADYRISFGHLEIGPLARAYVTDALDRAWVSAGPHVDAFEREFASHFAYPHAIATSSGTDAGLVTWMALADLHRWSRGDDVLTPAAAFVATANAVLAAGLTPRFVDIDLATLNINPAHIEAAITPRTRAIQAVHTMGRLCDMPIILDIARRHQLVVVEDACEAHGGRLHGQVAGTFGVAGTFSFYAAHLICSGEGGMIVTGDDALAATCRSVRTHGRRDGALHFTFDRPGLNAKMNDLEAAVGREGLSRFDDAFRIRRGHIAHLRARLDRWRDRLLLPDEAPHEVISPHAFPLVLRDPATDIAPLWAHLDAHGIQCKTLFGSLPTQHHAFAFLGGRPGDFPVAERLHSTGLHFGLHQHLTTADVDYVGDVIDDWMGR
jgi:dTDP-4-amino-4,6-dideoxygalactose transaminase